MKRRMTSLLAALMLLATAVVPNTVVWAEEELTLSVPGEDLVVEKGEEDGSVLDQMNSANESILGALGKKDWEELAASVKKTGDWREDLVAVAQSQVGYAEDSDGMTIYTKWAGYEENRDWTALFVNWVAEKAGLTSKEFPSDDSYEGFVAAMKGVNAVKTISRSTYPTYGDVALLNVNGKKLAAIVVYVSNGFASVIHGDDNGVVTRNTYKVDGYEFKEYVDLNELMERAGVEVGKGGDVPEIPEGGIAAWTNTNAVYMRKEPTTASKRVTTIKKPNTAVLVVSAEKQDDGYIWYGVEYKKYEGYIRGDLLKLDIAALPEKAEPAAPDMPGLNVQERVVNIEVVQGDGSQNVNITCEIYGATYYEWYQVGTGTNGEDKLMQSGEDSKYKTYAAPAGYDYYCVVTLADNFTVTSKTTTVTTQAESEEVTSTPVTAEAILGEDVYFTYTITGAATYQWFVKSDNAESASALVESTSVDGYHNVATNMLNFQATETDNNNVYYCVAYDAEGILIGTSAQYRLTVKTGSELTADLCHYVEELATMSRSERFEKMNEWKAITVGTSTLDALVFAHWQNADSHVKVYSTLLCTCSEFTRPSGTHTSGCPWNAEIEAATEYTTTKCTACGANVGYLPVALDGTTYTCAYDYLLSLGSAQARYEYIQWLDQNASSRQVAALKQAHYDHTVAGDAALICMESSDYCIFDGGVYVAPGAAHTSANCPWSLYAMTPAERYVYWTSLGAEQTAVLETYKATLTAEGNPADTITWATNASNTQLTYALLSGNINGIWVADGCLYSVYTGAALAKLDTTTNQLIDLRYMIAVAQYDPATMTVSPLN